MMTTLFSRSLLLILVVLGAAVARAQPTVTVVPSSTKYSDAGGSITFTVTVSYPVELSAAAVSVGSIPAGWRYEGAGGVDRPDITPRPGDTTSGAALEFVYASIPPSPIVFTFSLRYPAGLSGTQKVAGFDLLVRVKGGSGPQHYLAPDVELSPESGQPPPPPPPPGPGPKLVNISTRSQTTSGAALLIGGFVISGDRPKPVLIRAIGPTLRGYGVGEAVTRPHLDLYRGSARLASADGWGAAPNAAEVKAAAESVGAFALPADSADAAVLVTLEPALYSVVISGGAGESGIALLEVYDASSGEVPAGDRMINISTRAMAGAGDRTLIAGFVLRGNGSKRVLVRGAGPALASLGVEGSIKSPVLTVYDEAKQSLGSNAGWSLNGNAAAIAAASASVGAFPFAENSKDTALILTLMPGTYTAQVIPLAGTEEGVGLIEVYELP